MKSPAAPFNLKTWIETNRHLLKPPVGNAQIYHGNEDFIVMVVGGPNARKDFHVNLGEEIFYQLEGNIEVGVMVDDPTSASGKREEKIRINEGDLFLMPPNLPHCPRRGPGTVGLVIERYRDQNELDGFQWFCEECGHFMHEAKIKVADIVKELPVAMQAFYDSESLSTCSNCGTKMKAPRIA